MCSFARSFGNLSSRWTLNCSTSITVRTELYVQNWVKAPKLLGCLNVLFMKRVRVDFFKLKVYVQLVAASLNHFFFKDKARNWKANKTEVICFIEFKCLFSKNKYWHITYFKQVCLELYIEIFIPFKMCYGNTILKLYPDFCKG